ncbi:MAG: tetratricopeptide repeat protein [Pseudomonadota bacterium]
MSMHKDIAESDTGLVTPEGRAAWDRMVLAFLAHSAETPIHLGAVLEHEPDAALPLAAKGLFCQLLGRSEMAEAAQAAALAARKAVSQGGAPERARGWTDALLAWQKGSPGGAIFHLESLLAVNPADTMTMKLSHAIRFVMGDAVGMRRSTGRALPAHGPDHALTGYALGCHAFALEETGDYVGAERSGLLGLDYAADDAWGLHAVAHVYDMTHRPGPGISLIEDNLSAWSHCNNFRFHVWWHKALLHLDRGELDVALDLYDAKIRDEKTDDYRDISNATSLLVRLELEGMDVGARWHELAELSEARVGDGCLVFADLHYMLALTGDNRPDAAQNLAARIAASSSGATEVARLNAHPGQVAAAGLADFGEGRYSDAFAKLASTRAHMRTIGGSHAQRDVFERITVDAGLRAGQYAAVEAILADRTALRAGKDDAFAASRNAQIAAAKRDALYAAQ